MNRLRAEPGLIVAVAVGAVVGAGARWLILGMLPHATALSWPTMVVNGLGSLIMGVVVGRAFRPALAVALSTGFCGGLTTFSSFAVDSARHFSDDGIRLALIYIGLTVVVSFASYIVGFSGSRRWS